MTKDKSTNGSPHEDSVSLQVEYVYPPDLAGRFANHMIVQFDGHEYHLSFFELQPPLAMGTPEERKKKLQARGQVEAQCVARVVISATRMPAFAKAIVENMARNSPESISGIRDFINEMEA